jgi:hypothetical protein
VDCAIHDSTRSEDLARLVTFLCVLQPVEAAAAGAVALPHLHLHQPAAPAALRAVRGAQQITDRLCIYMLYAAYFLREFEHVDQAQGHS